ncbi:hypothetical protein HGRIS_010910 [Hohenbuehelia grisea]|uniref:Uncharacterized protein n=1 Tax=Hohenbuehelia grisea TaxID=104357 RepID=A0ABR3IYD3_9AGAR
MISFSTCRLAKRGQEIHQKFIGLSLAQWLSFYPGSAYDMLRYPIFTTKDLRCVVPHLADINLTILSRLKTQGVLCFELIAPKNNLSFVQAATARMFLAKRPTCVSSWRTNL